MSILKLNNKIITLGGSVLTNSLAKKGDLINMDLDGNGNKTYRVLKVDGNIAECIGMNKVSSSQSFGAQSGLYYSGSSLDTELNTTFYRSLSTQAKAAIIPKNIVQYGYTKLTYVFGDSQVGYSSKVQKQIVGDRYIYALDIEDIEMYFGGTGGSVNNKTSGTYDKEDIWKLFWNTTTTPSNTDLFWLRSVTSDEGCCVDASAYPQIEVIMIGSSITARPAFCIDLSKIPFIKTTEVIS